MKRRSRSIGRKKVHKFSDHLSIFFTYAVFLKHIDYVNLTVIFDYHKYYSFKYNLILLYYCYELCLTKTRSMFANTVGVALEDVLHVGGNFLKHDIDSANTYTNTESIKKCYFGLNTCSCSMYWSRNSLTVPTGSQLWQKTAVIVDVGYR